MFIDKYYRIWWKLPDMALTWAFAGAIRPLLDLVHGHVIKIQYTSLNQKNGILIFSEESHSPL